MTISFARHQFPPIIRHGVWLYLRFTLSYRDVEDLLAERGMAVTIGGRRFWLWRAVDDEGEVLDLLVQRRREGCSGETDAQAAQETRLRA